jgi:hypothetical protein
MAPFLPSGETCSSTGVAASTVTVTRDAAKKQSRGVNLNILAVSHGFKSRIKERVMGGSFFMVKTSGH